jgi:phosphoglycerol transferase MdoB-like AlkP superfamily enzyme
MRERFRILGYFAIFWITFQIIIRGVFLVYNHDRTDTLTATEIFKVFLNGLKMDISICGYFLMLAGLLLTLSVFITSKWLHHIVNTLVVIILLLSSLVVIIDLELYRHWGFRLNTAPFLYIGSEAMGSVEISVIIKLVFILTALFVISLFIYFTFLAPTLTCLTPAKKKSFFPLLIITALMFIPIRGSFSVAPMNTGFVYFHKTKSFANHAAINVIWNFLYSLRKSATVEYPENFFDKKLSQHYFSALYPASDSTAHLFTEAKPNVILFILESFTAGVIEPLGGIKNLTPHLNQLCTEGILFDNFYSSGDRTDKGIVSILSGYPAQPTTSIIKYPYKTEKLPYLNQYIKDLGYHTSFIYGGDIDFANFRSYLTNCSFDNITSIDDLADDDNESKWGIHDHIVLEKAFAECDSAQFPFFKVILTLSSHEPFDVPMKPYIEGSDQESLFLNSCHYTDKSIGVFITKAKQQPWWKNTVVLFVADHGHRYPGNKEITEKERFRIPFLMVGGAIKNDTIIHTIANQTDIANTLLGQLDKSHAEFKFSKNILSPNVQPFALYFFTDGYGYIAPNQFIVHDNIGKLFLRKEASEEDINKSKAYQQILYSDYNVK